MTCTFVVPTEHVTATVAFNFFLGVKFPKGGPDVEEFTGQPPKLLNRLNAILTTTLQNDKIEQIFVIYDITLVILQIFRLF
jgi:hypothetical protein